MKKKEKRLLIKYMFLSLFGIMIFASIMILVCIKAGIYVL